MAKEFEGTCRVEYACMDWVLEWYAAGASFSLASASLAEGPDGDILPLLNQQTKNALSILARNDFEQRKAEAAFERICA